MDVSSPVLKQVATENEAPPRVAPKRKTWKGAEILVEYLIKEKVPYLFGVCGHGNIGFLDAAADAASRIKTISVHHEQAAGYMADAYYKVRHEPVATITSCGPGSCNLPVALAGAMMDSSAFLAITGNVPTTQFNRMPFQETGRYFQGDFPSVIRPLVKKSFQPTRVEMLPLAVKQAFGLLRTGRPGPVNIDVPLDVFQETAEVEIPDPDPRVNQRFPGELQALARALELLLAARRPVVLVGQGGLIGEVTDALLEFLELVRIPVVTSPNGKGTLDETHELAFGAIGRNGPYAANEAARNADVVLALGCSFDDRTTSAWISGYTLTIPPTKLIQIDNDPAEIGRNYPVHLGIVGDIRASLEAMTRRAQEKLKSSTKNFDDWTAQLRDCRAAWDKYQAPFAGNDQSPLRPERLMQGLSRVMPEDAIFATDVGVHHNWVVQLWKARRPRHLLQSWGFASMGFATCGILGAKLAQPESPAVAVVGDGSFLMTPHILATAVEYDIPAVWVVWNNHGYCSIRDMQLGMFGKELATSFENHKTGELYSPDFAMLARSFGVESARVERAGDLEGVLETAIKANRPYLVEVPVDREIRPVGTGTWSLPPLPHAEPNFRKLAALDGKKN
ncbi:MAG TPA: thiamine pyrophosphate-binding protein [Burkholderiales bacterium]|nr:thiamine pyrophosphate-binding protein [Burkholderiales bacterium]